VLTVMLLNPGGVAGAEPADIDVLIVVTDAGLDRGPLYAAANRSQY